MKKSSCKVCKTEFYGRNNQKFCSVECKNKYNNTKTKLIYQAGRFGEAKIENIQRLMYENSDKISKANSKFEYCEQSYRDELNSLKKDYGELLDQFEKLYVELGKVKRKYVKSLGSAEKSKAQLEVIGSILKSLSPVKNKTATILNSMKVK